MLGTRAGDTELDAVFANNLGVYLNLLRPRLDCLEATIDDGKFRVDTCIDGDGTVIRDGDNGSADCSQAMKHGRPRFVDGVSAQVRLSARPGVFTP